MELFRALAALSEPPGSETIRLAEILDLGAVPGESEWSELFLFQLYPYASVYLGPEGQIGGEARDRIAGFWRALELEPPAEADHLAVMLAFYAELLGLESATESDDDRGRWRHVQRAFLNEHLLSWLPAYLVKLETLAAPFYDGWGRLLQRALAEEQTRLGATDVPPVHFARCGPPADPRRDGAGAFLDFLLAPLASGLIVLRSDLERAALDTGLAVRVADRRFGLESLLAQDARAVLGWLSEETTDWSRRLDRSVLGDCVAVASWSRRATATASLMQSIRDDTPGS